MTNTNLIIKPILCRKDIMDNYAYIITDKSSGVSAVVDASELEPIAIYCEQNNIIPQYIFTTHHHFDHVGANMQLKEMYNLKIVAPYTEKELIEGVDIAVKDKDELYIGSIKVNVISAPGHTKGHVLWYLKDNKVLFTGDVLFNLCIGGLFEGTYQEMYQTLDKIKKLPDDVIFYPGHEYTKSCLLQAMRTGENIDEYAEIAIERINRHQPVAPISLGLEKRYNPYLKIDSLEDFARLF